MVIVLVDIEIRELDPVLEDGCFGTGCEGGVFCCILRVRGAA